MIKLAGNREFAQFAGAGEHLHVNNRRKDWVRFTTQINPALESSLTNISVGI
jgi:hypothetical protein